MEAGSAAKYRLRLAEGFLGEAEQDLQLERWRSCVDNAQLAVENAGKTLLAVFTVTPKTHDPARELAVALRDGAVPESIATGVREILPDLLTLGSREHFLTDYGDESQYRSPWEIFTKESALDALAAARRCVQAVREILMRVGQ